MNHNNEGKLDITIKSNSRDLLAFMKLSANRKKRISKASNEPIKSDPMNELASKLHPTRQYLKIEHIKDETKSSKTFRLVADKDLGTHELAYFRSGQYLSIKVNVDGFLITRPYSIASSPDDALKGFYEITIKKEENGFLTNYIWESWEVGTKIESSGPEGFFYFDRLRDSKQLIGIAGGSGITPFRSIAKAIVEGTIEANLILLYGSSEEDDIMYYNELKDLENKFPDKFKVLYILSCEEVSLEGCEQGFITSKVIQKYCDIKNSSFFLCGPQKMYDFIEKEIERFKLTPKRVRREAFGIVKDVLNLPGFPQGYADKPFKITVNIKKQRKIILALATESITVAMERAKLAPLSKCRSGECGFCRSLLISGEIFINPISDWRRAADKKFGYFHPCSSYPLSDLEIRIMEDN
jgi:ferredoxin-NADP reductase